MWVSFVSMGIGCFVLGFFSAWRLCEQHARQTYGATVAQRVTEKAALQHKLDTLLQQRQDLQAKVDRLAPLVTSLERLRAQDQETAQQEAQVLRAQLHGLEQRVAATNHASAAARPSSSAIQRVAYGPQTRRPTLLVDAADLVNVEPDEQAIVSAEIAMARLMATGTRSFVLADKDGLAVFGQGQHLKKLAGLCGYLGHVHEMVGRHLATAGPVQRTTFEFEGALSLSFVSESSTKETPYLAAATLGAPPASATLRQSLRSMHAQLVHAPSTTAA